MSIKIIAAAALFAASLTTAAFAQPTYSDDYTNGSDGLYQTKMAAPAAPMHYAERKAPAYSDDYTNDSDGLYQTKMSPSSNVDTTSTASIKPLPDCHSMVGEHGKIHARGGDSGASRTDACRAMH